MKFFSIFFYLWLISSFILLNIFIINWFDVNQTQLYILDNLNKYIIKWNIDETDKYMYSYLSIFIPIFLFVWWWAMSWKIKPHYIPLYMAIIFWTIWYYIETVRTWFYIASIINVWVFLLLSYIFNWFIFWYIKKRKNQELIDTWLMETWYLKDIITDYSVRINWRPALKWVYEVKNPYTFEKILVETWRSFDPLFKSKTKETTQIYFNEKWDYYIK